MYRFNSQKRSPPRSHTSPLERVGSIKATALEWHHNLRRVQSEIGFKGPRSKGSVAGSGERPVITAAVDLVNRVAGAVPLSGSFCHGSESGEHIPSHSRWTKILPSSSPTSGEPDARMEEDPNPATNFEPSGNSAQALFTPPNLMMPSRSSSRTSNLPPSINVPERTEYVHIRPFNPDLTQIIDMNETPTSSPTALFPHLETYRRSTSYEVQEPFLHDVFAAMSSLDILIHQLPPTARQETQESNTSYQTAEQYDRKMLIIGSSYNNSTQRTNFRLSYASSLCSLPATQYDVKSLVSAFRGRGYSVSTMTNELPFNKEEVLGRIASFLDLALPGDVRALVFTGHSIRSSDGSTSMILPGVSSYIAISAEEWNMTIREHAKPGVIVLSIIAACFSGAFLDQAVRITNFTSPEVAQNVATLDAPVFITFSACGPDERAFESSIGYDDPNPRDLFLWALVTVARELRLGTWSEFMTLLQDYFAYARSMASMSASLTRQGALSWLYDNRQHPMIAIASSIPFPALGVVFPENLDNTVAFA